MDPGIEITLGVLMLVFGSLFIRHGWLFFIKKQIILSLMDKLIISLTRQFQGEDRAIKIEAQKSDLKAQQGVAFKNIIYGGMMLMAAILFVIDALVRWQR